MKLRLAAVVLFAFSNALGISSFAANPAAKNLSDFETECQSWMQTKNKKADGVRLHDFLKLSWARVMKENPEWASSVGYPGYDDVWSDASLETIARRKKEAECPVEAMKTINRSKLSAADQLNYDLFLYSAKRRLEGRDFPEELMPISQMEGIQSMPEVLIQAPKRNKLDYENRIKRLERLPARIQQDFVLAREGLKQGLTPPQMILRDLPAQFEALMPPKVEQSALYASFKDMPSSIEKADQAQLQAQALKIISEKVYPAYKSFHDFLVYEYIPKSRTNTAWSSLPNGKKWYEFLVRTSTTTDMQAEELHALGLKEVERLSGEMDKVMAETKFKGTRDDFFKFLRTDKQFKPKSADEILTRYRSIAKQIDPELPKLFGKLPRLTYGVKSVPSYSEKSAPAAYYEPGSFEAGRAGYFVANTYDFANRQTWDMESLCLHEAVPGHHLQIALSQEMPEAPEFRKHGGFTAYTEGWALYSETLGYDLGMYKDPYSRAGQINNEIWRAIRLVLDTGIHYQGWTRDQAISFFTKNSAISEHDAIVEVDRYIAWPSQALAYKVGQLTIKDLRDKAKEALKDKFDVRKFHDAILEAGSLPLQVLKDRQARWRETEMKSVSQTH